MHALLAMAGFAEAAIMYLALMILAAMVGNGGLIYFAWRQHSTVAAAVACVVCALLALLLQPWSFFIVPTSPDPEQEAWLLLLQAMAVFWAIITIAAVYVICSASRRRPR